MWIPTDSKIGWLYVYCDSCGLNCHKSADTRYTHTRAQCDREMRTEIELLSLGFITSSIVLFHFLDMRTHSNVTATLPTSKPHLTYNCRARAHVCCCCFVVIAFFVSCSVNNKANSSERQERAKLIDQIYWASAQKRHTHKSCLCVRFDASVHVHSTLTNVHENQ